MKRLLFFSIFLTFSVLASELDELSMINEVARELTRLQEIQKDKEVKAKIEEGPVLNKAEEYSGAPIETIRLR